MEYVCIIYVHASVAHAAGRALCLECGVAWVRIPPKAADRYLLWKSDGLGCAVLLCLVVCLILLAIAIASLFLPPRAFVGKRPGNEANIIIIIIFIPEPMHK